MPAGLTTGRTPSVLVTTDAVGGVWRYAIDLAGGLAADGVRTVLAVLGPAASPAQAAEATAVAGLRLVQTGLPLDWTAEAPADLERCSRALAALAVQAGVSSVHLHAPALVGATAWPAPVVVVGHSCVATWWAAVRGGPLPPDFAWRTQAASAGLRDAAAVIAPTAAHAAAMRRAYGPLAIAVVHNGRQAPGTTEAQPERAVLTAGRLWDEGKNAAALDRIAQGLGAPIRAAGPVRGPNGAAVSLPHLHLLGQLGPGEMAQAYAKARVFASLSTYEPFGLAVLEAAQAGMRLVLSDTPGFRELWDGAARFVADEADLRPALLGALDAEGDGGAKARAWRYTVAAMTRGTLDVHRAVGALA